MTEQNPEEYEDAYPLLGAIGPYLSFTTGHLNPEVEPVDTDDESVYDGYEPTDWVNDDPGTDYWEDEEQ